MGRPKTPIGAYGSINIRRRGGSMVAETRVRDQDGRLRQIRVAGPTAAAARHRLKERLTDRPEQNGGRSLRGSNSFADLAKLWLDDLELRDLAEGTRQNYRDILRLHVLPAFEHYTLAEITTGRVEWFLKAEAKASPSQAKQSRTVLTLIFAFALADLSSILDHHAGARIGAVHLEHRAGEDHSLTQGTSAWAGLGQPNQPTNPTNTSRVSKTSRLPKKHGLDMGSLQRRVTTNKGRFADRI